MATTVANPSRPSSTDQADDRADDRNDHESARSASVPDGSSPLTAFFRKPIAIAIALLVAYVLLARFTDPRAYLSTDTGGKVATVELMAERGDFDPDLGYWAEDIDPDGSLYPMFSTTRTDDKWVNVTTLPMLLAAQPLYAIGGYRAALLLPMLGSVAAALAAGALARRLTADGAKQSDGSLATWIVGATGPLVIYALDFWEHSIGVALMGWGVVLVIDALGALDARRGVAAAAAAGLCFGSAATMRQEALVYGFVAGLALVAGLAARRRVAPLFTLAPSMVVGALIPLVANAALESALIGESTRTSRGAGTVANAGAAGLLTRIEEAVITGVVPFAPGRPLGALAGLALVAALIVLARSIAAERETRPAVMVVGAVYLFLLIETIALGPGFVQGMIAATPLAGVGLYFGVRNRSDRATAVVLAIAVGSLPLVWAVQYTGGALPQWAGRYILTSGWALTVLAVVGLERHSRRALAALATLSLAITAIGYAWVVQRTSAFGNAFEELAAIDEPVLVFYDPFLVREGGPHVVEQQWLAASLEGGRADAADVLIDGGFQRFGYVDRQPSETEVVFDGWVAVGEQSVSLFDGYDLRVVSYERAP